MWLSWKSLYDLVAWTKNETAATGKALKMILGHRVIQVTNIA